LLANQLHGIVATLRDRYGWEGARDTESTWRIDDGTAAFYNYIYFTVAGLSEHDTFLSNLIREGQLTRSQALAKSAELNTPRVESLWRYGETIGIDMRSAIQTINRIPKLTGPRND
jgi:hypothetical protein